MSKYLIPFYTNVMWESNNNCELCYNIDKLYRNIDIEDIENMQRTLEFLDSSYLVNGYRVLFVFEKMGFHIYNKNKIEELKSYKTNSIAFMNEVYRLYDRSKYDDGVKGDPFEPVLIHSRWCRNCGSRKPNIYDDERSFQLEE